MGSYSVEVGTPFVKEFFCSRCDAFIGVNVPDKEHPLHDCVEVLAKRVSDIEAEMLNGKRR